MVFPWSLSDSKSPQVSRILPSFLAVLNYAVVWMVFTRPPTSKSSCPFNNSLVTVMKAPVTIGISVTFMFHSFIQLPSKVEVLILLSTFFELYSEVSQNSKVHNFASSIFLLIIIFVIIIYLLKFFTSALADGLSLEFEWQPVFSSLQDSSQYSGHSQKCNSLDVLHSSANFQVSRPFSNPLVTVPNAPITIGIIVTFMFLSFFNSLARSRYLSFFSHSFSFILWSSGIAKSTILQVLFFVVVDYY